MSLKHQNTISRSGGFAHYKKSNISEDSSTCTVLLCASCLPPSLQERPVFWLKFLVSLAVFLGGWNQKNLSQKKKIDALTGFLPPGQVNDPPLPLMDSSWKIAPEGEGGFKRFERGKLLCFSQWLVVVYKLSFSQSFENRVMIMRQGKGLCFQSSST